VAETREILESEGVDFDAPIAIYIGLFADHYYISEILAAAADTSDWQFLFVGEGELAPAVEEAAVERDNVFYPGAFDYKLMPGFLAHAAAGFCFKDAEQPLKLKEYGAAGLPTIAQPGELQRFYEDTELLFVEPEGQKIAATLAELSPDLREAYGEALREHAAQSSWEGIADGFRELFETAVSNE